MSYHRLCLRSSFSLCSHCLYLGYGRGRVLVNISIRSCNNMLPRQQQSFYPSHVTHTQSASSSSSDRHRSGLPALRSRAIPIANTPPTGRRISELEPHPNQHRNSFVCLPTYRRYRLGDTHTSHELCHIAQLEEEVNRLRSQHQTLLSTVQSLSLCDPPPVVPPPQLSPLQPLKPLPASIWIER